MENSLLKAVEAGIMTAQNIEEAQRYVQITLASNLLKGVEKLSNTINQIDELHNRLLGRLAAKIEEDIELLETKELVDYLGKINNMVIQSVEVQRKVAQGKELLASYPTLSDEEKEVVKMMKSLETEQDKINFIKALKKVLSDKEDNQSEDEFEQ